MPNFLRQLWWPWLALLAFPLMTCAGSDSRHWAYRKPVRPPLPEVSDPSWVRQPMDAFVLARLEERGWKPSPPADPYQLVRRVSLDLIGLPPSPEEADAFARNPSPNAYEQLVDRLLASDQFGVRWARPWLDLARYADSHGFQRDDLRDIWPYRDWVVNALNRDLPFDRFTLEQLAGDLLPDATLKQRVATGFNRCTPTNVEAGTDQEESRVNQIFDRVNTLGAVWLGTTLECAQCHDHKYDPFSQEEYYRLFAFFNHTPIETDFTTPQAMAALKFTGPYLKVPGGRTLVMQELAEPRPTALLKRGNFLDPGAPVEPGVPEVLHRFADRAPNRLGLARWLASRDNPLVARVVVNRWWAELFGQGLVATPEDFGIEGSRPTHPGLLDWLAVEFMERGWSMKSVLRTIVLSATYRQSSHATPEEIRRDDRNRWWSRGPRFRMDAEMIRDNALEAAGRLSHKLGGPPVYPFQPKGLWKKVGGDPVTYKVSDGEDAFRRGLYTVVKRASPYPSFVNFDATARTACVVRRSRSNTPLQALTLLNDPVYVEIAAALAARAVREAAAPRAASRIERVFRLCLVRPPALREQAVLQRLYDDQLRANRQPGHARPEARPDDLKNAVLKAEFAALSDVAIAVLNLDETISKP